MINVLEHVPDEGLALRNLWSALETGGRAIISCPTPGVFGTLDEVLQHRERYTPAKLERSPKDAGFRVEKIFDFNRVSVPGWWLGTGALLRQRDSLECS